LDGCRPEYFRGWAFVTSYSSATVAESHGIPCADAMSQKELAQIYKYVLPDSKHFLMAEQKIE